METNKKNLNNSKISDTSTSQKNKFDSAEIKENLESKKEIKSETQNQEALIKKLEKEIELLKNDNEKLLKNQEELENFLKRQKAEFDNYRKRVQEEKVDLIRYGSENFLKHFLTILDGFEKALEVKNSSVEINSFLEGFALLKKQIDELLEKHGVVTSTKINDEFNPSHHQAIQFVEGNEDSEKVAEIFQKGYFFHEKVLREAMVKITKKKPVEEDQQEKTNNINQKKQEKINQQEDK